MLTPQTEFADKKVVLFAVPGAFTPSCSVKHLPGYIENVATLKSKGVDIIAVIAYNDAYVMSAWGKANGIKDDSIVRLPFSRSRLSIPSSFHVPQSPASMITSRFLYI
jgi:peroxiredoxin